ncbi:Zinc finger BED domain-containing protein RICESLEEPER 4 [Bienertia sinuspersici]
MDHLTGESDILDQVGSSVACGGGPRSGEEEAQPDTPISSVPPQDVLTTGKKKRSWLWSHFEEIIKDGELRTKCIYCNVDVCGSSKSGTTVMKNHLLRCKEYPPNINKSQTFLKFSKGEQTHASVDDDLVAEIRSKLEVWKFKQDETRKALGKMIIMDELPFRFAEREGFRYLCLLHNQILFSPLVGQWLETVTRLTLRKKKNIKSFFSKCSSRISLTTNTWTSCQNLNYMCLTAHFIEQDWNLHKKNYKLLSNKWSFGGAN